AAAQAPTEIAAVDELGDDVLIAELEQADDVRVRQPRDDGAFAHEEHAVSVARLPRAEQFHRRRAVGHGVPRAPHFAGTAHTESANQAIAPAYVSLRCLRHGAVSVAALREQSAKTKNLWGCGPRWYNSLHGPYKTCRSANYRRKSVQRSGR